MNLLHVFAVLALLITGGAAALLNHGDEQQTSENPIVAAVHSGQDSTFREKRLNEAQDVENIVNNVLSGEAKPGDGSHKLMDIELYAKSDIDLSPNDMQTNKKYVDFVMSAEDVVNSALYKTGDEQEKLKIMKEKKGQI